MSSGRNFYDETVSALAENGYDIDDIAWVGNENVCLDTQQFLESAQMTVYEYPGIPKIPYDLKIVMNDNSYFYRDLRDECFEGWEHAKVPEKPMDMVRMRPLPLTVEYGTLDEFLEEHGIGQNPATPDVDGRLLAEFPEFDDGFLNDYTL